MTFTTQERGGGSGLGGWAGGNPEPWGTDRRSPCTPGAGSPPLLRGPLGRWPGERPPPQEGVQPLAYPARPPCPPPTRLPKEPWECQDGASGAVQGCGLTTSMGKGARRCSLEFSESLKLGMDGVSSGGRGEHTYPGKEEQGVQGHCGHLSRLALNNSFGGQGSPSCHCLEETALTKERLAHRAALGPKGPPP